MLQSNVNIGRLDRRITFQQRVVASNVSNEDEEAGWTDVVTVWAKRDEPGRQKTGDEEFRADKLTDYLNQVYSIRYRTDITPKLRIMDSGVRYDILSISEVGRKGYLKIEAVSGPEYQE